MCSNRLLALIVNGDTRSGIIVSLGFLILSHPHEHSANYTHPSKLMIWRDYASTSCM